MPNLLAELPLTSRVFIDANILIYHFTRTPISAICTTFLERVAAAAIVGLTSTTALAEVQHRLMVLEAIDRYCAVHILDDSSVETAQSGGESEEGRRPTPLGRVRGEG